MNGVGVHWEQAARGARRPLFLLAAIFLLGAGCPSATGPAKQRSEPPLRPFVGTVRGTLTIWKGGGRSQTDSFQVVFRDTTHAQFSWLRYGRLAHEATERVMELPPWTEDGHEPATPGVALNVTWPTPRSRYFTRLAMWGYYSGGGLDLLLIGRARQAIPQGDTLMISYPGAWYAQLYRP